MASLHRRIFRFASARMATLNPLGCYGAARPDTLRGLARWRWLRGLRAAGCGLDPSTEVRFDWADREPLGPGLEIAPAVAIDKGCIFWLGEHDGRRGVIRIGRHSYIGQYTFMGSCHDLELGENCLIGANSYLITVNHRTDRPGIPYARQGYQGGSIRLGSNVWLGCHVVVLPGISIGDNAVVGAGAVVTRNIPANEHWAGVPARRLGNRPAQCREKGTVD